MNLSHTMTCHVFRLGQLPIPAALVYLKPSRQPRLCLLDLLLADRFQPCPLLFHPCRASPPSRHRTSLEDMTLQLCPPRPELRLSILGLLQSPLFSDMQQQRHLRLNPVAQHLLHSQLRLQPLLVDLLEPGIAHPSLVALPRSLLLHLGQMCRQHQHLVRQTPPFTGPVILDQCGASSLARPAPFIRLLA
jgi:hypothetical protein